MSGFVSRSMKWLSWVMSDPASRAKARWPGRDLALDGATAVALAESLWCDTACLGSGFPASVSARAWAAREGLVNAYGARAGTIESGSAIGALASAIGVAATGRRVTAFLSGEDLSFVEGLLHRASGARMPMVVHVAARARTADSVSYGGGHESWHASSDAGWAQLFAITAQEAVDLALAARIATERSLTPVMVGMDGPETALSMQDVRVPEEGLVTDLLPTPSARVESWTEAQRMLFGERRRAMPSWYDADEPAMLGAAEHPSLAQAGRLGAGDFFAADAEPALAEAMRLVSERTGRTLEPVLADRTEKAELVIVAIGSAVETALVAASRIRTRMPVRVGVLGIRQLRPWPEATIIDSLRRATTVVVLERTGTPMTARGPLTREVLSTLARFAVTPTVSGAWHGVGGNTCRPREVIEACRAAFMGKTGPHLLSVGVEAKEATTPKQRVVMDATRRAFPDLPRRAHLAGGVPEPQEAGVTSVSVLRRGGAADEPASGLIAAVLHGVLGGRIRSRPCVDTPRLGVPAIDRIAFGAGALTPTIDLADLALLVSWPISCVADPLEALHDGGTLIVPVDAEGRPPALITRGVLERAASRKIEVLGAPVPRALAYERPEPAWRRREALSGAAARFAEGRRGLSGTAIRVRRALLLGAEGVPLDERMEAFSAGYEGVAPVDPGKCGVEAPAGSVRREDGGRVFSGEAVKDPGAFWSREGESFASGHVHDAVLSPFASTGVTPARTSGARALTPADDRLVEFVPGECAGHAALWTGCADGSITARALDMGSIVRAGMGLVSSSGGSADALTPLVGAFSKAVHRAALSAERSPETVREACASAYASVAGKLEADRRAAVDSAFDAVMRAIGDLPIARTPALFDAREQERAGSGAFLIIGFDPDRCADGGAAAGEGIGHGLRLVERTAETLEQARALRAMFDALPDTPAEIAALLGSAGSALMNRAGESALTGGDDGEPGSGSRLALRLVLAGFEAELSGRFARLSEEVEGLRTRLGTAIHEILAGAVPDDDLDALAGGLESLGREDVDLIELGRRVATAAERPHLDTARLRRLVGSARELADLAWRLEKGPTGWGRARYGVTLALGSGTLWAGSAPFNPFGAPVVVESSDWSPEIARGLCEGHRGEAALIAEKMRRARAVLDRPGAPEEVGALSWSELTAEERSACAPVLLIGDDEALTRGTTGSLLALLESGAGVKVVLLSGASGRLETGWGVDALGSYPEGSGADAAVLALLGRGAFVAQASVGAADHLVSCARRAAAFDGAALIAVHAPSPERHGFAVERTVAQARLAAASRAWPLWSFDPSLGLFGSCFDLSANPSWGEMLSEGLTPLDWAVTEARFRGLFRAAGSWHGGTMSPREGAVVVDPLDRTAWSATEELEAFAQQRVRVWRVLQEWAGVVTAFTERVKEEARLAVAEGHEREVGALKRSHEQELAALRAGFEAEAVERVREGLLRLAGYGGEG